MIPDWNVTSNFDQVWNYVIGIDFRSRDRIGASLFTMEHNMSTFQYVMSGLSSKIAEFWHVNWVPWKHVTAKIF